MSAADIPLALYIHLPWCVQKCPYCDFNSHALRSVLPEQNYLKVLREDLAEEARRVDGRRLSSVFIGGGTPSLFSARAIAEILECADQLIGLSADAEVTLEANPGTAEAERFSGFRNSGVNRLSIGVQSFDDSRLGVLGRIHSAAEARAAFDMARAAGFDNINLDLMFGLPGQGVDQALGELQQAIALQPEHVSWYQLTLEPNTRFAADPPSGLPGDDDLASMQEQGVQLLADHGFSRYEVSAYASSNRQCHHNLNYWQFGDYLGIGAGAHGKLTLGDGRIARRWKHRHPKAYQSHQVLIADHHVIEPGQLPFEFMLNALRLVEGVSLVDFTHYTGIPVEDIRSTWEGLVERQLVMPLSEGRLCCTEFGFRWLNDVVAAFLPD